MRFETVTAHAFGPFCDGRQLKLTPGMNVVYGANESGKSSLHAALQAGLCGVRHGKGPPTRQEKEFERRRRPWQGTGEWDVEVVIALANGRRIALRQNLAAKSGEAHDADLAGKDYSEEVIHDGTPDGARWMGLDRVSFLNTGCVRQADMLGIRDGAEHLQTVLQRAASKADQDATAAQALGQLEDYRKLRIGSLKAPTKPLRIAMKAVDSARNRLEDAKRSHAEYLDRQRTVKNLETEVQECRQRIQAVQALHAQRAASAAAHRLRLVHELRRRYAGPPRETIDDADVADQIAEAIGSWESAPTLPTPQGATCEQLESQRSTLVQEQRQLASAPTEQRPAATQVLVGVGLLVAAAGCFWVNTIELMFLGGIGAVAGIGVVWWAIARGKRAAAEDHAAQLAALTKRLADLGGQITDRRADDWAYSNALQRHRDLQRRLQTAARAAGIQESSADAQVEALRRWQEARRERLARIGAETEGWGELQRQLAGQSLDEIEREASDKRAEADKLLSACEPAQLDASGAEDDMRRLLDAEVGAQGRLDKAQGRLQEFASALPSIADAEDDCEDAKRRLKHLRELDETLSKTIGFLTAAQQRVHRDIAGVLRDTLLEWLPRVTGGRYTDCRVDPQTLSVDVPTVHGDWRNAELLSHGTAEQIYLLLRLALCRHLVVDDEVCPLILDDPVSACDAERQRLILETLLAISASTQVILFTHADRVRDWGHRRLSPLDNCQVVELPSADPDQPRLGTRIASRFRGGQLEAPFEELRGASIRSIRSG